MAVWLFKLLLMSLIFNEFTTCDGYREKGDYEKARKCLDRALLKNNNQEDSIRIYLNYARLYKKMDQFDSMKVYLDLVKNRVNDLHYSYSRKIAFEELAFYYENDGNIEQKAFYQQKTKEEDLQIALITNEESTLLANKLFGQFLKLEEVKGDIKYRYFKSLKIGITVAIGLFFLLVIVWAEKKRFKTKYQKAHQEEALSKLDLQRFALEGLRLVARNSEAVLGKNSQLLDDTTTRDHFLQMRANICSELARQTQETLVNYLPKGAEGLPNLTIHDYCIILLSRYYPESETARLLGYEAHFETHIAQRKNELYHLLQEVGIPKKILRLFFPASKNKYRISNLNC